MTPRCPQLLPALRERPGKTQELRIVVVNPVLIDEEDGIIAGHGRALGDRSADPLCEKRPEIKGRGRPTRSSVGRSIG
jgi:hypothetical protein